MKTSQLYSWLTRSGKWFGKEFWKNFKCATKTSIEICTFLFRRLLFNLSAISFLWYQRNMFCLLNRKKILHNKNKNNCLRHCLSWIFSFFWTLLEKALFWRQLWQKWKSALAYLTPLASLTKLSFQNPLNALYM